MERSSDPNPSLHHQFGSNGADSAVLDINTESQAMNDRRAGKSCSLSGEQVSRSDASHNTKIQSPNVASSTEKPRLTAEGDIGSIELILKKGKFVPAKRTRLHNDLLLIVGYLEFFNALDFPANIWQEIPVPSFAVGLMATGGSVALLASSFAFIDFRRSWKNVRLLLEERAFLSKAADRFDGSSSRSRNVQAWLSLNFRELGWELIDRALMDVLVGFAAILVGVGTLMAIGGADRAVFDASNLLSGYIGNGFVAVYGLVNAAWSAYLYIRARKHKAVARDRLPDKHIQSRAVWTFRNHQIYAVVNGLTLLVSSAGSLISSTMWWGYVILIPCIASSVFCNIFWRRHVGYDRLMAHFQVGHLTNFDLYCHIHQAVNIQKWFEQDVLQSKLGLMSKSQLLQTVKDVSCYEDLCIHLACQRFAGRENEAKQEIFAMTQNDVADTEEESLREGMKKILTVKGRQQAIYQERVLYELLGACGARDRPSRFLPDSELKVPN